jgi:hypothetical protein
LKIIIKYFFLSTFVRVMNFHLRIIKNDVNVKTTFILVFAPEDITITFVVSTKYFPLSTVYKGGRGSG